MNYPREISLHAARACPCGAGAALPLGKGSGPEGALSPPLIAYPIPVAYLRDGEERWGTGAPIADDEGLVPPAVPCPHCGAAGAMTHVVIAIVEPDGALRPVGADTREALAPGGIYDALGRGPGAGGN